jgi:hypothetical protein
MPSLSARDYAELTDELQDVFNETSASAIADAIGLQVFDVGETNLLNYEHQILHGVKGIEEVADGANLPKVNSQQGDNITYVQRYFGAIVAITKKLRKFELTNQMQSLVRSIVDDAWNKIDQSLADILLYGWSSSYTDVYTKIVSGLGADGVVLFNTGHSNDLGSKTFNNIIYDGTNYSPALSRAAMIRTIRDAMVYQDPNGLIRPIRLDTVLVCPTLADAALRIVNSDQISGSANWDPNQWIKGRIKEVKVWERLEATGQGTSRSAYWFMYDSKKVKESLKCLFSERPSLDAPNEVDDNKDWDYTCDFFYATGVGFQPYVRGSEGDNTSS